MSKCFYPITIQGGILQTNILLWSGRASINQGGNGLAWATQTAHNECQSKTRAGNSTLYDPLPKRDKYPVWRDNHMMISAVSATQSANTQRSNTLNQIFSIWIGTMQKIETWGTCLAILHPFELRVCVGIVYWLFQFPFVNREQREDFHIVFLELNETSWWF